MDYGNLTKAVWYEQAQLGWKNFLQGKLLPEWQEIINNERQELDLPPNLHAVPQTVRVLVSMSLNIWRTRCEFLHGGTKSDTLRKRRWLIFQQVEHLKINRNNLDMKK